MSGWAVGLLAPVLAAPVTRTPGPQLTGAPEPCSGFGLLVIGGRGITEAEWFGLPEQQWGGSDITSWDPLEQVTHPM